MGHFTFITPGLAALPRGTQETRAAQKAPGPTLPGWLGVSPALLIKPPQGRRGERPGRGATEKSSSRVRLPLACGPAGLRHYTCPGGATLGTPHSGPKAGRWRRCASCLTSTT